MSHPLDASRNQSYYYRYCYYYYNNNYYYNLAKKQFGSSGQSERGTFQAPNHGGPGSNFSGFAASTFNNPGSFPQRLNPPVPYNAKQWMVPFGSKFDQSRNLYVTRAREGVRHLTSSHGSQFANTLRQSILPSTSTVEPLHSDAWRSKTSDIENGSSTQFLTPPATSRPEQSMVSLKTETNESVNPCVAKEEVEHQTLSSGSPFTNTHGEEILPSTSSMELSYPETSRPKTSDVGSGNDNQSIDPPVSNMPKHEMVPSEMETDESVNPCVASKEVEHQALSNGPQFSSTQTEEMLPSKSTVELFYPDTSRPKTSDGDSGSSTLSWLHICKTQLENLFTQCDSSALSDFPDNSDSGVCLSTVRQHGSQSSHGFESCDDLRPDKPAPSDESHSPQDFQDTLVDILQQFGLERGDLQYFLSNPEDQINSNNLPHILNQIHLQKQNKAAPCPDPRPVVVCSGTDSSSSATESGKSLGSIPSNTLKVSEVIEYGHTGNDSLAGTDIESTRRGTTRGSGGHLSQFDSPGISSCKEPLHQITSEGKTSAVVSSQNQNGSASRFRSIKNSVVPPVRDTNNQLPTQPSQFPKRTLSPVLPSDIKSPPVELCWSGTLDNEFTPLVKMYDDAEATVMVFPHVCLLCNTECDTMTDWLTHQDTLLHLENCKVLRRQFPEWDGELKPVSVPDNNRSCWRSPRSSSRSHGPPRRHNKRRSSSRSRSRSLQRGSEGKSRRGSPSYESRSPSRSKDQKHSSPRRSQDLRSSPESSTPEQSRLTSPERLVKSLLLSSGVESLSQHSDLEAFVKALTPALMSELTKRMPTSSSSSAVRPGQEESEVRLRGIRASHSYRDVVRTESVRLHRDGREAIVVFRKEEDAEKLRSTKYFNLKGHTEDIVTEISS